MKRTIKRIGPIQEGILTMATSDQWPTVIKVTNMFNCSGSSASKALNGLIKHGYCKKKGYGVYFISAKHLADYQDYINEKR